VAITRRGRVIAHLVPVRPPSAAPADLSALWADLDALAAEIGARTPEEDR
jgi:antitoxin (DNA-binding transcriptional repressor) of toxin-antitoxin stability system